jgi:hypothetical protein
MSKTDRRAMSACVADAQGRALVMGNDDLDLLHAGHYHGMATDCRRVYRLRPRG